MSVLAVSVAACRSSGEPPTQDIDEVGVGGTLQVRVMRVVRDGFEMSEVTVEVGAR